MHCPMMMHKTAGEGGEDWSRLMSIPLPIAIFGMIVACMFGATAGVMLGKKCAGSGWQHGMSGGQGWHEKMAWKKRMMEHHHHGLGSPVCMMRHESDEDSPMSGPQAAE